MKCFLLLLFFGLLSLSNDDLNEIINRYEITGKVVGISDGDTFTILTMDKKQKKIRLHGIDAPEKKQAFGQVSKQKLSDLIFGKTISVEYKGTDRYRRIIGIAYLQDTCVNEEMLKSGLACHFKKYDKNPLWAEIENNARMNKKGLWVQDEPVTPWEYRKIKKTKRYNNTRP